MNGRKTDNEGWQAKQISLSEYRALPAVPGQSLLQSAFWGELKAKFGWQAYYLQLTHRSSVADSNQNTITQLPLLALCRRLPLIGRTLVYIPHGPTLPQTIGNDDDADASSIATSSAELICTLTRSLSTAIFSSRKPLVIRWDPLFSGELPKSERLNSGQQHSLKVSPHNIQPRHTIFVNLRPSEEEILERMKAKTRYNIRLSERKGVTVRTAEAGDLSRWYKLYSDTCARNRIGQRSLKYFQTLLSLGRQGSSDVGVELLVSHHQQTLLGGVIVAHYNKTATYLFGASSNTMRNLMANYLLQWEAMTHAKMAGCVSYDLFGVSPTAHGHYLSGLYRFKSGFGGKFVERWGSVDYITSPLAGRLYRSFERVYFFYHRRIKSKR